MDRRDFMTGLGALGAAGGVAQALQGSGSGLVTSDGFNATGDQFRAGGFNGKGNAPSINQIGAPASGIGLTLGYIPGSAEFVNESARSLELFPRRRFWMPVSVRAAINILGYVPSATPTIERVEVTVNFTAAEPPFFAPFPALFHAWQYVNVPGQYAKSSPPLRFTAGVPDAAGITVNFQVKNPISGVRDSGVLYYPIGGSGLGPGIYALAGLSPNTIGAPDWNQLTWGDAASAPLARRDGLAIDFDYITLVLRPTVPA